jgi:hypothetical protein
MTTTWFVAATAPVAGMGVAVYQVSGKSTVHQHLPPHLQNPGAG